MTDSDPLSKLGSISGLLQIDPIPRPFAADWIRTRDHPTWKLDAVRGKPWIGHRVVGADELGTAGQCLVALGGIVGASLARIGVGPRANEKTLGDEAADPVELTHRIVDLEPGGLGMRPP